LGGCKQNTLWLRFRDVFNLREMTVFYKLRHREDGMRNTFCYPHIFLEVRMRYNFRLFFINKEYEFMTIKQLAELLAARKNFEKLTAFADLRRSCCG
jgi:hypothetical protein